MTIYRMVLLNLFQAAQKIPQFIDATLVLSKEIGQTSVYPCNREIPNYRKAGFYHSSCLNFCASSYFRANNERNRNCLYFNY